MKHLAVFLTGWLTGAITLAWLNAAAQTTRSTMQQQYRLRVVGEGRPRVKGILPFVVPQAVDLVCSSAYTASIYPATQQPHGSVHLYRRDRRTLARWSPNPNHQHAPATPPAWAEQVLKLSRELGEDITWQTPT